MYRPITTAILIAILVFSFSVTAQAADPTMKQIYDVAKAGHLDEAQRMIARVLADHPNSAKAHYVQAELYAKAGKVSLARKELDTAARLNDINVRITDEIEFVERLIAKAPNGGAS